MFTFRVLCLSLYVCLSARVCMHVCFACVCVCARVYVCVSVSQKLFQEDILTCNMLRN